MVTSQLLTAKDLWNLGDSAGDYELIEGELVPMAPPGFEHGVIQTRIGSILLRHVEALDLGRVATDAGLKLRQEPDTVVAPDIMFLSKTRLPDEPAGYLDFAPDLAIEIVSPSSSPGDIERKLALYLQSGVRLVWIVYPRQRQVIVHTPNDAPRFVNETDEITGGEVLPGLSFKVSEIFA